MRRVGVEGVPVTVTLGGALAGVGSWGAALSAALGGLAQAEDASMDSARVAGMLTLASLELQAGRAAHALALVLRIFALALSSASLLLCAQAHLLVAKCLLGGAACPYPCGAMQAAAQHLDKAVALLLRIGAIDELKEAAYLRALTANAMNDARARDAAAAIFIQVRRRVWCYTLMFTCLFESYACSCMQHTHVQIQYRYVYIPPRRPPNLSLLHTPMHTCALCLQLHTRNTVARLHAAISLDIHTHTHT